MWIGQRTGLPAAPPSPASAAAAPATTTATAAAVAWAALALPPAASTGARRVSITACAVPISAQPRTPPAARPASSATRSGAEAAAKGVRRRGGGAA